METIFDQHLLAARKLRALRQGPADFLMKRTAEDLDERLAAVGRKFERAASLFSLTADAVETMRASGKTAEVIRVESAPGLLGDTQGMVAAPETVPFEPASIDLAVSLLTLHEANDLPGMLIQTRRALKPDGLFLAALAGAGTLTELRESLLAAETEMYGGAAPRVYPFVDVRDAGALLQRAGFALPVADLETITVRYPDMFALLADLRAMGATSALVQRSRKPASLKLFRRAAEIYADRFSDSDGRIRATFAIIWLSGWTPHAAQQKPLRPGSARASLETALREIEGGADGKREPESGQDSA